MTDILLTAMSALTVIGGVAVFFLSRFKRHPYMVGNGVCHCGESMDDHRESHSAVEMMRPMMLTKREWKRVGAVHRD